MGVKPFCHADLDGTYLNSCSPARAHLLREYLQRSKDSLETHTIFGQVLPVRKIKALSSTKGWWHKDGAFFLPTLPMLAWEGSEFLLETEDQPHNIVLLLHSGTAEVRQGYHKQSLSAGDGVLLSGESFTLVCQANDGINAGTALIVDPSLLLQEANALAHLGWIDITETLSLQPTPLLIRRHHDKQLILMDAIESLVPAFVQLSALQPMLQKIVLPSQSLVRLLTILILDLAQESDHPLDAVLKYIMAHLGETLTLSHIEQISNYSSRGLQYAFHERCGCSPMKWVRMQRITLAHQRLLNLNHNEPIYKVALACGYRSISRFNHDFKQAYGVSPSTAIRQGRHPLARKNAEPNERYT